MIYLQVIKVRKKKIDVNQFVLSPIFIYLTNIIMNKYSFSVVSEGQIYSRGE